MSSVHLLCLVFFNAHYPLGTLAAIAGPYWLRMRQAQSCPQEEVVVPQLDWSFDCVLRYNHTTNSHVMDVNSTVANKVLVRDASTITLDISRWDTVSGWRNHFLVMPLGEACFVYEELFADIMKSWTGGGLSHKCPVEDKTYSFRNLPTRLAPIRRFPLMPYGRYKVYVYVGYNKPSRRNELRSCFKMLADVDPKT